MCKLVPLKTRVGSTVMVAEHKVDQLKRYMNELPEFPLISKIYLFGSTLEERCTEESDIDLCVTFDTRKSEFMRRFESFSCDHDYFGGYEDDIMFVNNDVLQESCMRIAKDIKEKGVLLYDRM